MTLLKPKTESELLPPFTVVGDPEWVIRLRAWLAEFDFRFEEPSTELELAAAESRLGITLPADWRDFLLAFGPLELNGFQLSPPSQIRRMDSVWFESHLKDSDRAMLPQFLQVGEYGSDSFILANVVDGWVCECCHDPGGFWDWCPSFSDFLRVQLVRLWSGYYGWPDPAVQELSDGLASRWLATWEQLNQARQVSQLGAPKS